MKKIIFVFSLFLALNVAGQNQKAVAIEINTEMFVQLVFKSPIQTFKVGLPNLVEVQNNDNTLTVQALDTELKTNLNVKTADGLYYSFILKGTSEVPELFFEIDRTQALNFQGENHKESKGNRGDKKEKKPEVQKSIDEKVLDERGYIRSRNTAEFRKINLTIKGIYVNANKLYFLMEIYNRSNIKYDVSKLAFITSAKRKNKKQVKAEEQEFEPLYFYKELLQVAPKSKVKFVAVFDKFTLNSDKEMEINLSEKDGERVVRLLVDTETITDAQGI
ncbi:DUF4138 domain-containing protein [Capnocytophaga canimorsus]|uniref:DUF4138 domain-containing protein n=1 Tax=Capnocytophaga canimorsus TaxID=28188 RepID=UPI0037D17C61